jgi:hypothetical protein
VAGATKGFESLVSSNGAEKARAPLINRCSRLRVTGRNPRLDPGNPSSSPARSHRAERASPRERERETKATRWLEIRRVRTRMEPRESVRGHDEQPLVASRLLGCAAPRRIFIGASSQRRAGAPIGSRLRTSSAWAGLRQLVRRDARRLPGRAPGRQGIPGGSPAELHEGTSGV